MSVNFDEKLYTGNDMIDTQHKELIDRANKLMESCVHTDGKRTAVNTLDFLLDYTDYHFGEEEKLQESSGYPKFEEHKKQHEIFKKSVEELKEMLEEEEGPTDAFVAAVNKNVGDWLVNHIQTWDKAVADYVKSNE